MDRPLTEAVAEMRARAAEAPADLLERIELRWCGGTRQEGRDFYAHIAASCPSNVIALADGFDERGREIERLTRERDEARAINSEYLATPVGQYIARATAAEARVRELADALARASQNATEAPMSDQTPATSEAARGIDLDMVERAAHDVRENGLLGCVPGNEHAISTATVLALVARIRSAEAERDDLRQDNEALNGGEAYGIRMANEQLARAEKAEAARDAAEARVKELEDALRPFAKVAEHWRANPMKNEADCPIAWASGVAARLLTCMASELPRIKFEAFRRAARLLSGGADIARPAAERAR